MRPYGYGNSTLEKLTPELRERGENDSPRSDGPYRWTPKHGIPVEVEGGTSFECWWVPNWRDIWEMMRGHMIRVSVNYSLYGPIDLDVVSNESDGRGTPGRRKDW